MLTAAALLATLLSTQQPATNAGGAEIPVLRAGLGPCLANFTVTDGDGMPVYAASIRVKVRYGMMSLKRMELEVSTDTSGRAIVQGLPKKARTLGFSIQKGNRSATAEQSVKDACDATHKVTLK